MIRVLYQLDLTINGFMTIMSLRYKFRNLIKGSQETSASLYEVRVKNDLRRKVVTFSTPLPLNGGCIKLNLQVEVSF